MTFERQHTTSTRPSPPKGAAGARQDKGKCACGKSPGAGACVGCAEQEPALRAAAREATAPGTQTAMRADTRPRGENIEAGAHVGSAARLGHDFSRVRVHAGSGTSGRLPSDLSGEATLHDMFIKGQIGGDESPSADETLEPFSEPEETLVEPAEDAVELGNSNCPVTAVFSSTLVGKEKSNCQVPAQKFGAATLARFVLHGVTPGAGSSTVGEQFKKLSDTHGVFDLLKPNSYTTNGNIFDDCYSLFSTKPLPADLELKVEQNHLLGDQVISKNIVTYTADRITIRPCKRQAASCDFATVCRR